MQRSIQRCQRSKPSMRPVIEAMRSRLVPATNDNLDNMIAQPPNRPLDQRSTIDDGEGLVVAEPG